MFEIAHLNDAKNLNEKNSGVTKKILFETTDICILFVEESSGSVQPAERHSVHELVIRLSGSSSYQIDGQTVRLEPNGVLAVAPYTEHSSVVDAGLGTQGIVVLTRNQFSGSFFGNES